MGKYIGPKSKIARKFGEAIYKLTIINFTHS